MPKKKITKKTLRTIDSLKQDFLLLGLKPKMKIIVHSSLSSIGWVCGGASAVVIALMEVITEDGLIMMPTHSSNLSEPSVWKNPPVPKSWWSEIRETMPAFNPRTTPTEHMGKIPEVFRSFERVKRSYHPSNSFAVWGKNASDYIKSQKIEFSMSMDSPLGELYKNEGSILLIGVGYGSNTSLHLSETMVDNFPTEKSGGPIIENGLRVWKEFRDYKYNNDDFELLGNDFEKKFKVNKGLIGSSESRLIPIKDLVDFASTWIVEKRYERQINSERIGL